MKTKELTGSYVGKDHISCSKEHFFNYNELEERCDNDKIYLFQLHNNSNLKPLVLFAVFNIDNERQALKCAIENNCVLYKKNGLFDDDYYNSFLEKY